MSARPFALSPVVAILVIVAALPARAQFRNQPAPSANRAIYSIAGAVWDDSTQQRLENIRVDLKTSSGEFVNTVFSGSNGDFEFTGLGNGEYYVEVTLKDYDPFRQSVVIENSPRRGISVFMRRSLVTAPPAGSVSPTVSAHQLSVPAKARGAFDKGMTLLYMKANYAGAVEQFDRAIKDFSGYYEAYAQKAVALVFTGDKTGAEAAYRTSIDLSKRKYPDAMFLLSGFLNDQDKYADSEPLAREGLALDDSSWRGHLELARALVGLKKPDEAEPDANEAAKMKPDQPAVYLVLANIHIQKQNAPALLQDLDNYLKVAPNGPAAEQARKTRDQLQASLQRTQPLPPPPDAPTQQ